MHRRHLGRRASRRVNWDQALSSVEALTLIVKGTRRDSASRHLFCWDYFFYCPRCSRLLGNRSGDL